MSLGPGFTPHHHPLRSAPLNVKQVSDSVISYFFVAEDAESLLRFLSDDPITVRFPDDDSVPFPIGTTIFIEQAGSGVINISEDGVILWVKGGGRNSDGQYGRFEVVKVAKGQWSAYGDLVP